MCTPSFNATARRAIAASSPKVTRRKSSDHPQSCWRARPPRPTISPISRRTLGAELRFCCRRQPPIGPFSCSAYSPGRDQLSPDVAPLSVSFAAANGAAAPDAPFIAVSDKPPAGANPRVRFDRGRVDVADRAGHTLLDLGGFVGGAVAQVVEAGDHPGLWIKPLATDGAAPSPNELHLDHGDVAFIDGNGVALAMSTERDTVVRISYPDQVSWLTVAERFRSWIIGGLWLFATAALLLGLQRLFRRRPAQTRE